MRYVILKRNTGELVLEALRNIGLEQRGDMTQAFRDAEATAPKRPEQPSPPRRPGEQRWNAELDQTA